MPHFKGAFHHGERFGINDLLPVRALQGLGKFLGRRGFFLEKGTQFVKKTWFCGCGCFFCLRLILHTSRQQLALRRLFGRHIL